MTSGKDNEYFTRHTNDKDGKSSESGKQFYMPDQDSIASELQEDQFAKETLERYTGCSVSDFGSNLMLTNFPAYVEFFAKEYDVEVKRGSMFTVAHSKELDISILDFRIGSPAAALVVDLCSFLPIRAAIFLGMCGGLRRRYKVGEYLMPVAAIRGEGTSDFYFPPKLPSLANFLMQKAVSEVLESEGDTYHVGICYTTNMRFWEFNKDFIEELKATKAQAIEMECATLFTASYKRKFTLGALLLISDLPLEHTGRKTKESSKFVFESYMSEHIEKGKKVLLKAREMQAKKVKGAYHRNQSLFKRPRS
ncbi:MAG: AMP nucleosidase [Rhabdochlamydiaceae bacterium]|nr:AMP nucleosidase [Candidatus Amphrikana amoebophyrae]